MAIIIKNNKIVVKKNNTIPNKIITGALPADMIAWYDASDITTITENNGAVSQWNDKSGNDYHATTHTTAATTGMQALNGKNVIQFNNDWMNMPTNVIPQGDTPYTILAVWQQSGTNSGLFALGSNSTNDLVSVYYQQDGFTFRHNWYGNNLETFIEQSGTMLSAFSYDGTFRNTRLNTIEVGRDIPGIKTTGTSLSKLGAAADIDFAMDGGYIAEFIIYHRALSSLEILEVEKYLDNKWLVPEIAQPMPPTDMVAWYDASDAATIIENNGEVSQWSDKSGNDYHATTNSTSPTTGLQTLNGKNTIKFNGDYMNMPNGVIPAGTTPYTVCAMFHPNASQNLLFSMGYEDTSKMLTFVANYQPNRHLHAWYYLDQDIYTPEMDSMSLIMSADNIIRTTIINGLTATDRPTSRNVVVDNGKLGGGHIGLNNSILAEFIVYHRVLSQSEIKDTRAYLETKWQVPKAAALISTDGLAAWYDADDASTIIEAGGAVNQWSDKSGNDNHATANSTFPTTGAQTLNGKNVIQFNNDYMNIPSDVIPKGGVHYTILAVWKPVAANQTLFHVGSKSPGASVGCHAISTGLRHFWWADDDDLNCAINTPISCTFMFDGSTKIIMAGEESLSSNHLSKNTGFSYATLGGIVGSGYYLDQGYIAELIIYYRALTSLELEETLNYLNTKWGL